jgi:hypothetical protein
VNAEFIFRQVCGREKLSTVLDSPRKCKGRVSNLQTYVSWESQRCFLEPGITYFHWVRFLIDCWTWQHISHSKCSPSGIGAGVFGARREVLSATLEAKGDCEATEADSWRNDICTDDTWSQTRMMTDADPTQMDNSAHESYANVSIRSRNVGAG